MTQPNREALPSSYVVTGVLATVFVVLSAFALSMPFGPKTYITWVAFVWMTAVPAQIVMGLQWHFKHPAWAARLQQPVKGLVFLGLTVAAMPLAGAFLYFVPGRGVGPTPMLIMATIMSVVATFWIVVVWRCWPLTVLIKSAATLGIGTWVLAYALGYFIFRVFFNFGFAASAPFYNSAADPGGALNAWTALVYFVTTSAIIVAARLFDLWPIPALYGARHPAIFGIYASIYVLIISVALMSLFTKMLHWDLVDYMVRVPVSLIFGVLIVSNMMHFQLFRNSLQPQKGVFLLALTVAVAIGMQALYRGIAPLLAGAPLPEGGPHYERELWVATALLGVTFPLIIVVSGYFDFWPFLRTTNDHHGTDSISESKA
jgi:uncharacterized membrane protein